MKRKEISTVLAALIVMSILSSCDFGLSAEELTKYYSEKATGTAKEITKDVAKDTVSTVDKAIDNNDTASYIRDGAVTAGEYAHDAAEYITDDNTISKAKDTAERTKNDTVNFFGYWIEKLKTQWKDLIEIVRTPPSEIEKKDYNIEDISEYDAIGNFKNPFLEAKGIDTSSEGTLLDQLKSFVNKTADTAKETGKKIKENHDSKHPVSDDIERNNDKTDYHTQGDSQNDESKEKQEEDAKVISEILLEIVPEYSGAAYVTVNNNVPFFTDDDLSTEAFEYYSELDRLGRCGVAYANVCREIMPTEPRQSISDVRPTGFKQAKYDILKNEENPQGFLYARCHLIGYQLGAENSNPKNLITGTLTQFNVLGMEPFENMVASYVRQYNRHVLYRVQPIFKGDNLVASGVLMEARSVEDDTISFCVYVYNVAPGIVINYIDGSSSLE